MRKQFTIFLILIFALGLIPVNFSLAITQNQINAEVQIVCPDKYGNVWSGSGTIIDSNGIILTNKHVVTDQYGGVINTCAIGFIESISQEPNFYTNSKVNVAEVKYYTTTDDMDAAILYLENPTNKTFPYINIWDSNSSSLQFGDKIEIIGFPSIGGSTITYTSGDFSGFGSASYTTKNYIKTTAPLEHGNSGGASYNSNGQFIGIPTAVVAGSLNSISYILSINSIKTWLNGLLGIEYKQGVIEQEPVIEESNIVIQNDITAPNISKINLQFYDCSKYFPERDSAGNVQYNPTINGVKGNAATVLRPEQCVPITYDIDKSFKYEAQTLYVKLDIPNDVWNDIYRIGFWWANEPLKEPLRIQTVGTGSKAIFTYENNFIKPFPSINTGEGKYYFSLQLADESGNISETKTWMYNYDLSENVDKSNIDYSFSKKQAGKILLQVESHGEAYYINPKDSKRYYMANGNEAYRIMRYLGIGITNNDLSRVKSDKNFAKKHSGKIFLQVESHGEAYYIDFDGNAHYLKDGGAAYAIMRDLGLGITNSDLDKIPEGGL